LVQCHFSRIPLPSDLEADQKLILGEVVKLVTALVDVISSQGWLAPALAAMELSQMTVQALWTEKDSYLKQLPHFTQEVIDRCTKAGVESVFDLMDLEDEARQGLLQLGDKQLANVARVCNRYPNVEVSFKVEDEGDLYEGGRVDVLVDLEREMEEGDDKFGAVDAPFYPKPKDEGWWLVVGDTEANTLLCIKRVSVQRSAKVKLDFSAPKKGKHKYTLYFMADAYAGCDQEYELVLNVGEPRAEESSESGDK